MVIRGVEEEEEEEEKEEVSRVEQCFSRGGTCAPRGTLKDCRGTSKNLNTTLIKPISEAQASIHTAHVYK